MYYSDLVNRAAEHAAVRHRKQLRKGTDDRTPYVQHCFMVGYILERAGFSEEVVAAGILHDVLEDTESDLDELKRLFGERVALLVSSVTEQDKALSWEVRKARYRERLSSVPDDAKAITAADKIHNINSIINALKKGDDAWSHFKRGRLAQLERFRRLLTTLKTIWMHPLVNELEERFLLLESMGGTDSLSPSRRDP